MLLYTDILSGDELLSDAYEPVVVDDVLYEVNCSMITLGATKVNTGANASAEEPSEAADDDAPTQVNNVINSFRLQETQFDKKSYLTYLKGYMKAVKEKMKSTMEDQEARLAAKESVFEPRVTQADIDKFEAGAQKAAKRIIGSFKDYEFYTGESMAPEGMVALLNYREDGITPYFTMWKDGLKETKL